jgi:hypothetical protein
MPAQPIAQCRAYAVAQRVLSISTKLATSRSPENNQPHNI